jgi:HlyD family secretion protein
VVPLLLAGAAAATLYVRSLQPQPATGGSGPPVAGTPTATAILGDFERTIRLTGATAARNFAIMVAPQMRGGRGTSLSDPSAISTGAGAARRGGGGGISGGSGPGGGRAAMVGGRGGIGNGLTLTSLIASGALVNKGDIVAEFDREEMMTRLDDFQAQVRQTQSAIENLKAQREVVKRAHDQTIRDATADVDKARLDLKTSIVVSAIDAEGLRLATEEAEVTRKQIMEEVPLMETSLAAQWRMAELALGERTVELERIKANVDRMTLRAPLSGLVVMQTTFRGGDMTQIRVGDQVGSGQPVMRIVDPSSMIMEASVNQVDAELIRIGAKARVHFDAYPELEVPAEVFSIGAMATGGTSRTDYVKQVPIALRLLRVDTRVIPDLSASADVVLETAPQTVIVPREAVFRDGPESKPFVFVRQPEGWAQREVDLGPANFVSTAIRSGLRAGEVIARERPVSGTAQQKK